MLLRTLPLGELVFDELLISHPGALISYRDVRQIHTHTQASYFFTDNIARFGSGKGAGKILVPPTATCDLAAVYYMSISPLKIRQTTRHLDAMFIIVYPYSYAL